MIIPGPIIALLTFPGVIVHEFAHKLFCDIFNVPVYYVNYFIPLSDQAGRVIHKNTDNFWTLFFISVAPLIVNSLLCMLFTFPFASTYFLGTDTVWYSNSTILNILITWLGYSIGFHAIPSNQDVKNLDKYAKNEFRQILIGLVQGLAYFSNLFGFIPAGLYALYISTLLPDILLTNFTF
ncbi:metalloprotease family protein [Candidatus Babela massiliensis]|uniref:Membrane associated metal-dependent protease n=1 Tax=Candidatus Babela massiliensis TaxID=673862 RepID=V6DFS8_9BACT|nr:metalloprotease family protein [Candidatus Babela massiliensis]CDK30425.1 Membrane associated metal-dependent protease [Candidatus Babela massiliensis]